MADDALRVLERGDVSFVVRPRVMLADAVALRDVQRLFVVLQPNARAPARRLVVGRKRLPRARAREKQWAYVDRVGADADDLVGDLRPEVYDTKTAGPRTQAGPREVAWGRYVIAGHEAHAHLAYEVEGATRGDLVRELCIGARGNFVASVFNPEAKTKTRRDAPAQLALELPADDEEDERYGAHGPHGPHGPRGLRGLGGPREPSLYDDDLSAKFEGRRFAPLEPAFLDHVGCELVLVATDHELDVDMRDIPAVGRHGSRNVWRHGPDAAPRHRPGRRSPLA